MSNPEKHSRGSQLPNLYLVGFMGVGKSVLGRRLAVLLKMQFLDSDHAIEAAQGRPITLIFEEQGEATFREMERAFMEAGHPRTGCVVSCGGGLVCQPGMVELVKRCGIVYSLFARPETIIERTSQSTHRPLLQCEDPAAKVRALLAEREPYYRDAGIGITTDGRSSSEIARQIMRSYQRIVRTKGWPANEGRAGR